MRAEPRLRVAYVSDTMASMQMLEGLAERFDLTLVSPASLGDRPTNWWPPRSDVEIRRVTIPGGRVAFVPRAARWLARRSTSYDAAIALDPLIGALAANVGRLRGGPPVVLQVGRPTVEYVRCQRGVRSTWAVGARLAAASVLVAFNQRRAAAIGTVSDYVAEQCRRHNDRVTSIPWQGVDTERFAPVCSKVEARRRLGLPVDDPVVMWRSRLAPEKDPDTFLAALAQLARRGRSLTPVYMGGETDEMERLARRHGVPLIARNAARADEIPLWYVAADVNVQTSRAEGLGLSVAESLACLTPVVVSNVGGLPETVDGGRCGRLVPPGDVDATAAAIADLLDDETAAMEQAARGRTYVEERFGAASSFDAWADLVAGVARQARLVAS